MDRLAELEAQAATLNIEIAKLRAAKPTPPPRPPKDEGVRVFQFVEPSNFVRPTEKELTRLYDIVLAKYPQLASRARPASRWAADEAREYFEGFVWSFERLGFIGRTAMPDTKKHYVNFWVTETQDWLRLHRPAHRGNIGAGFLAAVVAHGDIPFIVGNSAQGIVWSVGLTTFGGAKATDAWRRVLGGNVVREFA
jgi:hypothetical protein